MLNTEEGQALHLRTGDICQNKAFIRRTVGTFTLCYIRAFLIGHKSSFFSAFVNLLVEKRVKVSTTDTS